MSFSAEHGDPQNRLGAYREMAAEISKSNLAIVREERRYEIAKAVLASVLAMPEDQRPLYPEKHAVAWADALLAELECGK